MKLYLAMSCFQGRPQKMAFEDLLKLSPDGIQLTPGNKISIGFKELVINSNIPYRFHHSFCWTKYRDEIYNESNIPMNIDYNQSIHPPQTGIFSEWIDNIDDIILEVMYPGYLLGNDKDIEIALSLNKRLAIDISHLFIGKTQKSVSDRVINKILNYQNIAEIHISHNAGKFDSHQSINENTPFLSWAKEMNHIPIIYESYMHKLSFEEQNSQLDYLRN